MIIIKNKTKNKQTNKQKKGMKSKIDTGSYESATTISEHMLIQGISLKLNFCSHFFFFGQLW